MNLLLELVDILEDLLTLFFLIFIDKVITLIDNIWNFLQPPRLKK